MRSLKSAGVLSMLWTGPSTALASLWSRLLTAYLSERDSMYRLRRSVVRDRTNSTTLTGHMIRNLNAF